MNIKAPKIEDFKSKEEIKTIEYRQRLNPPENKLVYKYRDWNNPNHRRTLKGKLYFSSASDFNDPFDCKIPFNNLIIHYADLHKQLDILIDRIVAKTKDTKYWNFDKHDIKDKLEFIYKNSEDELGILCLSGIRDNNLMWSHYADAHKGFLIGFDFNSIHRELEATFDWVSYVKEINNDNIGLLNKYYIIPFLKSEVWFYEEELRFIKEGKNNVNRECQVSTNSIKEIILGVKMNEIDKEALYYYCKKHLPHSKVLSAKTGNNGYSLEFDNYLPSSSQICS